MSKHTPGPWKADIRTGCVAVYPNNESHNCLSGIEATAIHYQDGRGEQPESGYRPVTEEQIANTFLMAAAPVMLDALKKILGWREYHDHFPDRMPGQILEFCEETASAAIAAAEGKGG